MKIILINNLYKPYARGGAERVVENITKALLRGGHEVRIITTRPFLAQAPRYEKGTSIYYIPSLYYNLGSIPKFLRFFWHILDMCWPGDYTKIKSILKKEKPDLVVSHNLKGIGLLASRAIRSSGVKHIHTLHDIQLLYPSGLMIYGEENKINSFFGKIYSWLSRLIIGSPDFVVSPSAWLLNLHGERGFFAKSRKYIWPNPIDLPENKEDGKKDINGITDFFYAGQIEDHKGVPFLAEVFDNLRDKNIKLTIAGDGSLLNRLEKYNGNRVVFLGKKNKKETMALMRKADCLIVPSLCYENSPTVIYEAFAVGLPVLASRLGGIEELLPAEYLFEAGNADSLINRIKWLIGNKFIISEQTKKNKALAEELKTENYIKKILSLS